LLRKQRKILGGYFFAAPCGMHRINPDATRRYQFMLRQTTQSPEQANPRFPRLLLTSPLTLVQIYKSLVSHALYLIATD